MTTTPKSSEYFQKIASEWDNLSAGYFGPTIRQAAIRRAFLRPEMAVADIGCGTGFLAAALSRNACGNTYNLGTGREIRIGDLANMIINMVGKTVKIKVDQDRLRPDKSEVLQLISDYSKAGSDLDWHPCASLDQGLEPTIKWISNNLHHYLPDTYLF